MQYKILSLGENELGDIESEVGSVCAVTLISGVSQHRLCTCENLRLICPPQLR